MERVVFDCLTGEETREPDHEYRESLASAAREKYAAMEAERQENLDLLRAKAAEDPHFAALLKLMGV